jgi:hypothetical protein
MRMSKMMRTRRWKELPWWIGLTLSISASLFILDTKAIHSQSLQPNGNELDELRNIGDNVAKYCLAKDTEAILRYDRPDLADEDRKLLSDKKSDLYCYLFDTSCITWKGRSVYDVLRNARKLDIKVKDLGRSADGSRYSLVLFFDGSKITEQTALSQDFLCKKGGKEIVTWTFSRINGKWVSAHPPFDAETDVYCNQD